MTANKNYQWVLIGILSIHFGVVFFDRNAFGFLTSFIQPELHLTNTQIGLIGGAFSLAWAISGLTMGSLSDRFGHRKAILIVATLVFALSSVLSGIAPTFLMMLGARMIMGVAEGGIMPITQTLIAAEVTPERRGLAQGITQNFGANLLANSLGPIIVVWMANDFGWRNAFYLVALPGFLMALVIGLWVREPSEVEGRQKPTVADARKLMLDPTMVVCMVLSILLVAYFVIFSNFMPLYLVQNKQLRLHDHEPHHVRDGLCVDRHRIHRSGALGCAGPQAGGDRRRNTRRHHAAGRPADRIHFAAAVLLCLRGRRRGDRRVPDGHGDHPVGDRAARPHRHRAQPHHGHQRDHRRRVRAADRGLDR